MKGLLSVLMILAVALGSVCFFGDSASAQCQVGQAGCGAPSVSAANRLLATQLTAFNQLGGASAAASTATPSSGFVVPQGYVLVPQAAYQSTVTVAPQAFVPAAAAGGASSAASAAAVPTTPLVAPLSVPAASTSAASACSSGACNSGGGLLGRILGRRSVSRSRSVSVQRL